MITGCLLLFGCVYVYVCVQWLSCVWLFVTWWPVACQAPVHRILPSKNTGVCCHYRGSSQLRDRTQVSWVSCIGRRILYRWHHLGRPCCCLWTGLTGMRSCCLLVSGDDFHSSSSSSKAVHSGHISALFNLPPEVNIFFRLQEVAFSEAFFFLIPKKCFNWEDWTIN